MPSDFPQPVTSATRADGSSVVTVAVRRDFDLVLQRVFCMQKVVRHSSRTLALLITWAVLAESLLMNSANSAGVDVAGAEPFFNIEATKSGERAMPLTSSLIFSTMAGGVPAGAQSPSHAPVTKPGRVSLTVG